MAIREIFRKHVTPVRAISLLLFCGGLAIGITLLWTQQREFFGEVHTPHDDARTIHVKPNREYQQTFAAEGRSINGVVLLADPGVVPASGTISIKADDGIQSTAGTVAVADIFPAGELYIPFSPPLHTKLDSLVTLRITSTADVDLKYQIDSNKYKAGSLSLLNLTTNITKPVAGDLAFQVHYHTPAADRLHLSVLLTIGGALIAVVGWVVLAWLLSQPASHGPRFSFAWGREDTFALVLIVLIVGTVYGFALFRHPSWWSANPDYVKDVIYLRSSAEALRGAVPPVWQMNMCGGQPLLGNPEGNTISLGTIFAAVAGPVTGMKITVWLEVLIAAAGAYILGRMLGLSPLGALLVPLLLTLCGFIPNRAPTATMFVAGAAAMPWMVLTYLQSLHRPRWLLACAAITVAAFLAGDTHVMVYAAIAIGVIGVGQAIRTRQIRPLILLGCLGIFLALIGAVKLLPTLEGQSHYHGKKYPGLVVLLTKHDLLADVFFSRDTEHPAAWTEHGNPEGWDNIGLYTGVIPILMGVAGLLVAPRRVRLLLLLLIGVFFLLGEGTIYEMGLRPLGGEIRSLFRLPSRSLIVLILFIGVSGGYVIDWLTRRFRMIGTSIGCLLLVIIASDLSTFALTTFRRIEEIPPTAIGSAENLLLAAKTSRISTADHHPLAVLDRYATVSGECPDFNNTPFFTRQGYEGPLVTALSGYPQVTRPSPHKLHVIPSTVPSVLQVHLAASPLLHVTGGIPLSLPDGSFQVFVPKTSSAVEITYTSQVMLAGLAVSVGSLSSGILLCLPRRKKV